MPPFEISDVPTSEVNRMSITKREFKASRVLARHNFFKSDVHFALTDFYVNKNLGLSLLVSGLGESVQLIRIMGRLPWSSLSTEDNSRVIRLISMILCEFIYGIDAGLDVHLVDSFMQGVLKIVDASELSASLRFDIADVELQVLTQKGEIAGMEARRVQSPDARG